MPSGPYKPEPALTDLQERFAVGLSYGLAPTEAARVAGYAHPHVAASSLRDHPGVRQAVRQRRNRRIDKLASLALHEAEEILKDRTISPAVRLNAIKLILGLAGHVEAKAPDGDNSLKNKNISDMTVEELDAFIAEEKAKRADSARPVIDHESCQRPSNLLIDNKKTEP